MAISGDILIDYTNKRIYMDHAYNSGTDTAYTSQELYSYIQDTFDELDQMDDTIPMSAQTPNAFTMINGWFIDDETIKWFKDGAIGTSGWIHPTNTTGIRLLKLDAAAGLTSADIGKAVAGVTTTDTGKLLYYDTTRKMLWVRCDADDDLFDNASEEITVDTVTCGNMIATSQTGENLYVNLYTLGTLTSASDTIYVIQASGKISAWWASGIDGCDVLIKVKELGTTIDSGNVTVFCRYYPSAGDAATFDHFPITLTAGRQAVPLATALDLNNTSSQATVADYLNGTTYTMTVGTSGPYSRDLNNGYGATNYDVEINCDGAHLSEAYEMCKYVCREGSTQQLFADNGEEYIYANASYAPVKASPLGTFAGGKFFGARGVWITNYHIDDLKNFQLIASNGTVQNPPNTVVCTISSVIAGDRCGMFVLASEGGEIKTDSYTVDGTHTPASTTLVINEAIIDGWAAQNPPLAGNLRIIRSDNTEVRARYSSWTGSTFTIAGNLAIKENLRRVKYAWTLSGSGTTEYYVSLNPTGDPSLDNPGKVYQNDSAMTEGTLGTLAAGEWGYGNNDTLGYSTVYVRLTDGTDPDTKGYHYVEAEMRIDLTGSAYDWTASGSGTNEYYVHLSPSGNPSLETPAFVFENNTSMTKGTKGTLAVGQYDYGDNDTLGYSTVYVRLTDEVDPDTKSAHYIEMQNNIAVEGNDVWIPVIDDETPSTSIVNTLIQEEIIYVTVRVRKKGIIPFEVPRSIGSTGLDVPAVRTTDGIVI